MNFNILILLFLLVSCGVKAPPTVDSDSIIPSYIDSVSNKLNHDVTEESNESNVNPNSKDNN